MEVEEVKANAIVKTFKLYYRFYTKGLKLIYMVFALCESDDEEKGNGDYIK